MKRAFEEFATGRFPKEEVLETVTRLGLRTRSGLSLNPQSFGRMLTNRLYAGLRRFSRSSTDWTKRFCLLVSERSNAATPERLKTGHGR